MSFERLSFGFAWLGLDMLRKQIPFMGSQTPQLDLFKKNVPLSMPGILDDSVANEPLLFEAKPLEIPLLPITFSQDSIYAGAPAPEPIPTPSLLENLERSAIWMVQEATRVMQQNERLQGILLIFSLMALDYYNCGVELCNIDITVEASKTEKRIYNFTAENKSKIEIQIIPGEKPKIFIDRQTDVKTPTVYHIDIVDDKKVPLTEEQLLKEPITFDLGQNQVVNLADHRSA